MKNKIIEALKAKFVGVSDTILGRIADKLAKTITSEEQVATQVEGVTFQQILESYGDSRATEAQQTAVSNYEKKHGLKDGQKVENGGTPKPQEPPKEKQPTENIPEWAKGIIESNKALRDELQAIKGEKVVNTRKQQLEAIISKLPENLRKPYARISLDNLSDDEFNTLTTEVSTEVETIVNETKAKGAVFGSPHTTGKTQPSGQASDKEIEDIVSKIDV